MKNWEDKKDLVFPHMCLVRGVENFFIWLERKMEDGKYSLYKLIIMSLLYNIYKKQIYLHLLNNIKINTNTFKFTLIILLL